MMPVGGIFCRLLVFCMLIWTDYLYPSSALLDLTQSAGVIEQFLEEEKQRTPGHPMRGHKGRWVCITDNVFPNYLFSSSPTPPTGLVMTRWEVTASHRQLKYLNCTNLAQPISSSL
jgi:hypothetical protein